MIVKDKVQICRLYLPYSLHNRYIIVYHLLQVFTEKYFKYFYYLTLCYHFYVYHMYSTMNSYSVLSTQLFLFPIIYAYRLRQDILFSSYSLAYVASVSHHYTNEKNSNFHLFDIYTSRLSTIINFWFASQKLPFHYNFLLLNNLTVTYLLSCSLYDLDHPYAILSYVYFHAWVSVSAMILSYNVSIS